jgi:hypothetical protein
MKPTDALSSNFVGITTLHVSGSLSAHHREFLAVHRHWYILSSLVTKCYQAQDAPCSIRSQHIKFQELKITLYWELTTYFLTEVSEKPATFFNAYIKMDDAGGRGFFSNVGKHAKLNDAMSISDVTNSYLFALSGSKVNQTSRYQLAAFYIVTLRRTILTLLY